MMCDSYFLILVEVFMNHVSAENICCTNHIEWTEHKVMGFEPPKKQIIWQCHNFKKYSHGNFSASSISLLNKSFVRITFYGAENKKKTRQLTIQTFVYYLFTLMPEKYLIKGNLICSVV